MADPLPRCLTSGKRVEMNDDTLSTVIVEMAEAGLLEIDGDLLRITEKDVPHDRGHRGRAPRMADRIGVARRWVQHRGAGRRAKAVAAGAVEMTMRDMAIMCRRWREETARG